MPTKPHRYLKAMPSLIVDEYFKFFNALPINSLGAGNPPLTMAYGRQSYDGPIKAVVLILD